MGEETNLLEAEDFLEIVWGERKSWVDLPAKVGKYWVPFHLEWPSDLTVSRRIDSCLRDAENLYFSVCQFSKRGRNHEDALPTAWLWADLDETHPSAAAELGLMPTFAWQSSPGRHQALWQLDRALKPSNIEKVNQALSYALGADRGGWDLTQVLRLPGTRNFKYPDAPMVELLWYKPELSYNARYVWSAVKHHYSGSPGLGEAASIVRRPMPTRARVLLRVGTDEVVEGERSARLWELECLLAEAGWNEEEIYSVVSESAWNKWANVRTGENRLRREILKAMRHVMSKTRTPSEPESSSTDTGGSTAEVSAETALSDQDLSELQPTPATTPFVRYASFMAMTMEEPRWLIENIWTASSHGILGGEPKTSKTALALAAAISVASGRPFLGEYEVHTPGPVLFVQEENAPWMIQDRMRKIARSYGLIGKGDYTEVRAEPGALGTKHLARLEFPTDLPVSLLNNWGLNLAVEDHRDLLEQEIASIRPALVVLDPLYLILGGVDTDRAKELFPYLKWLIGLRYQYNCAIMLVHHFNKKSKDGGVVRAGQRLLGSTTLHGWSDSALYTEALDEARAGWIRTRVETEFRSMGPRKPLEVALTMGEPGDLRFEAEIKTWSLVGLMVELLGDGGMTVTEMAERLGHDKRTLLSRIRGNADVFAVESGRRGRGHTHRISLVSAGGGGSNGAGTFGERAGSTEGE